VPKYIHHSSAALVPVKAASAQPALLKSLSAPHPFPTQSPWSLAKPYPINTSLASNLLLLKSSIFCKEISTKLPHSSTAVECRLAVPKQALCLSLRTTLKGCPELSLCECLRANCCICIRSALTPSQDGGRSTAMEYDPLKRQGH
jgi:hypothetical protein